MYSPVKYIYIYRERERERWLVYIYVCVCVYVHAYVCYCPYIWARWVVKIMKIWQLIYFDCIYCQNFSMKTKFILCFLFILIILVGLHNIHILNYTRNILKKIAYQTPKNILKLIFKSITKHWKMRQFSKKCYLENEPFSRK